MSSPHPFDPEIPMTQTAVVFTQHGEPHTVCSDWPVVQPEDLKPGQVLVRLAYSGVCGSDIHAWKGDWPRETKLPLVGGHEGTGRIAAIGKGTVTSLKIGDRVGTKWLAHACLNCEECRRGLEPACDYQSVHGYTIDGTFQQWCVSYASHVTPIPAELPLDAAVPFLCAGVSVYKALKEFAGAGGDVVVVSGAGGGLGHLACQYARAMGYKVIPIDSGDEKRKLIASYGFVEFIDFKHEEVAEKVKMLTDGCGAHCIMVVANGGDPYANVQSYLRPYGTVLLVGGPDRPMTIDVDLAIRFAHRFVGSPIGNRQDAIEALRLAVNSNIRTTYAVEKLESLSSVFEHMEAGKIVGRTVLNCE